MLKRLAAAAALVIGSTAVIWGVSGAQTRPAAPATRSFEFDYVARIPALARRLRRAETDSRFYHRLKRGCARLRARFQPAREQAAWKKLLRELGRRKT